ncbi:MAG: hypothetical protein EAZ44_06615 [Cytophagia bacterium]|nr:MAG: hypothetical protein EAZ44_06615 [Cytophagia bacterium]TAG42088.1 MAG: hypothetical protein EAZ31_06840 [Cytophagia bacterium]
MNKKKYLLLLKIKKTLGRSIVILRMTEVWRLLLNTEAQVFETCASVFFYFFGTLKPVGGEKLLKNKSIKIYVYKC